VASLKVFPYQFLEVKVKVEVCCCVIKHYALERAGGVEVKLHTFLTSALIGSE
jgi:hypothetical protein